LICWFKAITFETKMLESQSKLKTRILAYFLRVKKFPSSSWGPGLGNLS